MTVESDLVAHLNATLPGLAVYPHWRSQTTTMPAVVYEVTAAEPIYHFAGPTTLQRSSFELSIIAATVSEMITVATSVRDAVSGGVFGSVEGSLIVNEVDAVDPPLDGSDDPIHRRTIDIDFWHQEISP